MRSQLKKQGNSKGFTIPAALLEQLGWKEGAEFDLTAQNGALLVQPLAPALDVLLASVKADYSPEEISWGSEVGLESEE